MKKAEYKEQYVEEYFNNPAIEALPLYGTGQTSRANLFTNRNIILDKHKRLDPELKLPKLDNLSRIFVPMDWAISLSVTLDLMIRESYRKRNPILNDHIRQCYQIDLQGLGDLPDLKEPAGCTILIGPTGMGKTTTIEKYLQNYDQVICHENYCGIPFDLIQIVYLHITVPHDGTVKGFCTEILSQIDQLIGTSYVKQYQKASLAVLSTLIAKLCSAYQIGLIVLDECQNLLFTHYGKERLSEFINVLSNKIGTPFLLVGTPKARELLDSSLHLCRRLERKGSFILRPYEKDSPEWIRFLRVLFQDGIYTEKDNPLTPELIEAFHTYSLGIPGIAKELLIVAQLILFSNHREETITSELLESASHQRFPSLYKKIGDIQNSNLSEILRMGDWVTGILESVPPEELKRKKTPRTEAAKTKSREPVIENMIFTMLNDIGYSELFSQAQLKEQARLLTLQIGPGATKAQCAPIIIKHMAALVEEHSRSVDQKIPMPDLQEDIADENDLF